MSASTPTYKFLARTGPDISETTRSALRDMTVDTEGTERVIALQAKSRMNTKNTQPESVHLVIATEDGALTWREFHAASLATRQRVAYAFACLATDPSFESVRNSTSLRTPGAAWRAADSVYFTPSGILLAPGFTYLSRGFLFDRREDPDILGPDLQSKVCLEARIPQAQSSAHGRIASEAELGDLVTRLAAASFDAAMRKDQTWMHKRPQLQPQFVA